jgi:hypothetical protein
VASSLWTPTYSTALLQATVNGANDDIFRNVANYLVQAGYPDAIIRLGWELSGTWYPWSVKGNEAVAVAAWRHAVGIMKGISNRFQFDWNVMAGYSVLASAYPGNDVVDIIGFDLYDQNAGVAWNASTRTWVDPAAAFDVYKARMNTVRDFALAHGKRLSIPEWGMAGDKNTGEAVYGHGGDDPVFVQGMFDWMNALPADGPASLAYHAFFQSDVDGNQRRIEHFPKANTRFMALYHA